MNAIRWLIVFGAIHLIGCNASGSAVSAARTGGDPARGAEVIRTMGCGSCHTIPGIRQAQGRVGPPLMFFAERTYIAGQLPNTPENLVRWVKDPRGVEPGTAMPDVGLNDQQARDVAAYLYTLH